MTTSDELRDIAQWIPSHLAAKVLQIADELEAAPVAPALVPLTDEQIDAACISILHSDHQDVGPGYDRAIARAIEAANSIK